MAGKLKFDPESAFKSIIGAGTTQTSSDAESPSEGRTELSKRETKKRISLSVYPSSYEKLQKIAFVNRRSASDIISELIADYVSANADKLAEYEGIKVK